MQVNGNTIIPGDVLLKHSNQGASPKDFVTHGFIKATQKLQHFSGDHTVVHAALFVGNDAVVEAVGKGLIVNAFDPTRTDFKWEFWRYVTHGPLRELAADVAMNLAERRYTDTSANKFGDYATTKALKHALVGKVVGKRSDAKQANELDNFLGYVGVDDEIARDTFYCSEVVTFAYHLAARFESVNFRQVINLDYRAALPSKLKSAFEASSGGWAYLGERRGFTC